MPSPFQSIGQSYQQEQRETPVIDRAHAFVRLDVYFQEAQRKSLNRMQEDQV